LPSRRRRGGCGQPAKTGEAAQNGDGFPRGTQGKLAKEETDAEIEKIEGGIMPQTSTGGRRCFIRNQR
jgi:hypothetical protein